MDILKKTLLCCILAVFVFTAGCKTAREPVTDYVAVLITTNVVYVPCMGGTPDGKCKWCRPEEGMRVPEHMNKIDYDLKIVVSTNYLPVILKPD